MLHSDELTAGLKINYLLLTYNLPTEVDKIKTPAQQSSAELVLNAYIKTESETFQKYLI